MSETLTKTTPQTAEDLPSTDTLPEIRIYSRSNFFYWWPVWLTGFIMAILTYAGGDVVTIEGSKETITQKIYPSRGPGIIFTLVLLSVISMTSVTMRGLVSVLVIVLGLFFAVLFAWLGWWDDILRLIPQLSLFATGGFYLFFSIILLIAWLVTTFVTDKMTYWLLQPGQLTHSRVIGESEKSYDTRGMIVDKLGEDFFRHRILGLGSGDIRILTSGARHEEIMLQNVLWVDRRIEEIQRLVNVNPDSVSGD